MSAARVSLSDLLAAEAIERVPVDSKVARNLLRQAGNHLTTASAGTSAGDHEGAFQLAYDACRKACLALVLATGMRTKGSATHVVTFQAASAIAANFGAGQIVHDAANLRFVRHGAEYRAESVSPEDAQDAIAIGHELLGQLIAGIERVLQPPS